jgi:Protein of unknown function (DUF3106)
MKYALSIWIALVGLLPLGIGPVTAQVRPGVRAARQIAEAQRRADAQIERLRRMTPDQRERVLSLLAPERRRRVEARLAELDQMNDDQRARLGRRLQQFRDLPPADRERLRDLAGQLNSMDPPRRQVVRRELLRLRALNNGDRQARLDSPGFRRQYSTEERTLLDQLSLLQLPEE